MRIVDGYTEVAALAGRALEFRPMLQPERRAVLTAASTMTGQARRSFLCRHFRDHVIDGPTIYSLPDPEFIRAMKLIVGSGRLAEERQDARNIYEGTRLKLLYPHLSRNTCEHCLKWWFDPVSGETYTQDKNPLERMPEEELLCRTVGCPLGSPEKRRAFTEKNQRAFEFDLHCRAIGQWPDDPIVKRNAYLIGLAAKRVSEERNGRTTAARSFA